MKPPCSHSLSLSNQWIGRAILNIFLPYRSGCYRPYKENLPRRNAFKFTLILYTEPWSHYSDCVAPRNIEQPQAVPAQPCITLPHITLHCSPQAIPCQTRSCSALDRICIPQCGGLWIWVCTDSGYHCCRWLPIFPSYPDTVLITGESPSVLSMVKGETAVPWWLAGRPSKWLVNPLNGWPTL